MARQLAHGDGPAEMEQGRRLTRRQRQLPGPAVQLVPDPGRDLEQQAGDLLGSRPCSLGHRDRCFLGGLAGAWFRPGAASGTLLGMSLHAAIIVHKINH